jgi:hypothetical protein
MIDPILRHIDKRTGLVETNKFILNSVRGTEKKLTNRGINITSGRIISEQSFGFWTDLFENHHYKILKGRPIKLFKNLPAKYGRNEVLKELSIIRRFRNRINHNEPICFIDSKVDFTNTILVYKSIMNLFKWINPELTLWVKDIDKINPMLNKLQLLK